MIYMKKLAIITSHPIQYNAPLFRLLASQADLTVKVFYSLGKDYIVLKDKGFGKAIAWDIPLLNGYTYKFLENTSKSPGTFHFNGIDNPYIIRDILDYKPSAILVFGWNFKSHLKVLKYFMNKVPIYFRGDSTLLDEQKSIKVLLRRIALKWVYKYINKAFYVGTNNKKYFMQHGVKEQNLIFAPHAIDNERFGDGKAFTCESKLIRSKLRIPAQYTVFLFSGKFANKKSPLLLIKAFKKLNQERISLLLVGNGLLEGLMKEEARGCSNIHFLPFQNQTHMPAIYRSADVFVLPSGGPGETWGLSVNEAMACGLAIITSDKVGCAVDLVKENINGYIFEAGKLEKLIEKLSLCAAMNKVELKSLGNASKGIINDWSFEKTCAAIVANLPDVTKAM
jgi:glycosyltransferase involved in cell wall biosynthesis